MTPGPGEFLDECEEIALELRGELGLGDQSRLDPRRLAAHLAIDIHSVERFRETLPREVAMLTGEDAASFAAATVFRGTRCLILVNPSQSSQAEALSIVHELAHLELEHEPTWPLFDERGRRRRWRANEEVEADCLAEAMLAPRSGVSAAMSRFAHDPQRVAGHFGITSRMLTKRVAATRRRTAAWPLHSLFRPGASPAQGAA
jgi:Zn-dependent peptidase ImmA (M78 family)